MDVMAGAFAPAFAFRCIDISYWNGGTLMFRPVLRRFRGMIALYTAFGVACAVLAALSVRFYQLLVDRLTSPAGIAAILPVLAGYGVIALLEYLVNYLEEYPHNQLKHGMYQYIRRWALEKVSRIDYTAYQEIGTGQLVQLVENGAAAGRDILFEFYLRVFTQLLPGALCSVAFMGMYDVRVMLGALSGYVVVFIVTKLLLKKLHSIKEETLVSQEALSRTYVRAFMEMVVFRVNRRFARELARAGITAGKITDANTRIRMVHEFFFTFFAILVLAIKVLMILLSIPRVVEGSMSVGVLLALLTLTDRVYQPIAIFNVIFVDYRLDRVAWERFSDFLRAPDDPNLEAGLSPDIQRGEIRFEHVSFAFGDRAILTDINAVFAAGQTTALLGRSGAGKSTLVSLALGLRKPTEGRVLIDGQDMAGLNLGEVYRHIAYVSQDAPVFDGTVRENISFDSAASEEALWDALCRAELDGLIRGLQHGLDTQVGERGVKLSGGEKQRLALARIFFQQPAIIILDEPTSALDRDTERAVLRALRTTLPGRAVLVISHSEEAVAGVDRSILLENGKIAEGGGA